MDFFQTKHPVRKIGLNKYAIGGDVLDPLVLIDGHKIETYELDVKVLDFDIGRFDDVSGDNLYAISGTTQKATIENLKLKSGVFEVLSGNQITVQTGSFGELSTSSLNSDNANIDYSIIGELTVSSGSAETFFISGVNVLDKIFEIIDDLSRTGQFLTSRISSLSGNLSSTGAHLHEHIDSLSGNLLSTGAHLHEHIDSLSGNLLSTGAHLHEHIESIENQLLDLSRDTGTQLISGDYAQNRFKLGEAFEEDELGDIVPTNQPFVSDTMWILKGDGDLELRANIWRFNTGPNAFTDDISF